MKATTAPITRIKGLSQVRRLPRLGKIRLGERRVNKNGVEYPKELHYFKFDDESLRQYPDIERIYGPKPTELDVFFPVEDPTVFFPQAYKLYGRSHGLKCKGDGERAVRMLCEKCCQMDCNCKDAGKVMNEVDCPCDLLDAGQCRAMGSLMVMLPRISCGGVWQIDTGSYHSIVDINSGIDYVIGLCGRIAMVPLKLRRVPRVTHGNGRASTHYTLQIVFDADIETIARIQLAAKPAEYLIERPRDEGDVLPALPEPEEEPSEDEAEKTAGMITDRQKAILAQYIEKIPADVRENLKLTAGIEGSIKNATREQASKLIVLCKEFVEATSDRKESDNGDREPVESAPAGVASDRRGVPQEGGNLF